MNSYPIDLIFVGDKIPAFGATRPRRFRLLRFLIH